MSDEAKEKEEAFAALVSAVEGRFPYLASITNGGQHLLRIQHGGVIFNIVLSRSRDQRVHGDWQ